ncbi:FoF1 ATP synthase subunit gamma [Yoonia sp.]|jgi:F-type H+-transporting ATPase subunit gamma|uniref:F0F1 ATP synthase subunit gamma n=1 Tax=Yoonia sp. TaxID=2212373 RepID=UPI0025EEE68A|nr:FoF1 ATP synthase subunit gamma [Yoonia sp.]
MAQTLEALSRRTASMQGIRSIVHTMKTLSAINAAPYDHAARGIEAYHDTILLGLQAFLARYGPLDMSGANVATRVLVVFGSDHGLCGNYNEALATHVAQYLQSRADEDTSVLCVGAQMAHALSDEGIAAKSTFFPPASVDGIERLANLLTRHLDDIRQAMNPREMAISLAYFARETPNSQKPQVRVLLPLDPELIGKLAHAPWQSRSRPFFSMAPDDLLREIIRNHLFASIFRAAADALATENAARLALMQQAEKSVDDRLEELVADMRTMRQSEITSELMDVIIGFEAFKKKKDRPS